MPDDPGIQRRWLLSQWLSRQRMGLTIQEMAHEFGVTQKTIRRDLEFFRAMGVPLEETIGEYGRKTWKALKNTIELALNHDEVMALYLGTRLINSLAGTPFDQAAQDGFRKLRATLSKQAIEYLDQFSRYYHISEPPSNRYNGKSDLIDQLRTAVEDHLITDIVYQSDGATEPASRSIYPLAIHDHNRTLYLVAIDPEAKPPEPDRKIYKVVRIEEVELTSLKFQRPANFDVQEFFKSSFGVFRSEKTTRIKVRFAPSVARYVRETPKHHAERHTRERDGSLIAEYELSSTVEIKSWIMGFGSKAVVLEPESLRTEIRKEAEAMASAHAPAKLLAGESAQPGRSPNERRTSELLTGDENQCP